MATTLEPVHRLGVQMVGWLVEQQHVRLLEQDAAERHTAALAPRQQRDVGVVRRKTQCLHRDLDLVVEIPEVQRVDALLHARLLVQQLVHLVVVHRLGERHRDVVEPVEQRPLVGDGLLDILADILGRVELRLLRQVSDLRPLRRPRLALKILVDARHDAQQ
jgi:hypothetical protein